MMYERFYLLEHLYYLHISKFSLLSMMDRLQGSSEETQLRGSQHDAYERLDGPTKNFGVMTRAVGSTRRSVVLAWALASEVHQCCPPRRGKHPPRFLPCRPFPPLIATSSQDASSYGISTQLHLSLFSHFLAQLCSDFTAFLRMLSMRYGITSTMHILSSAPGRSFRITFAKSRWMESHGPIQSQPAQRSFLLTSSTSSIATITAFFQPWTMAVSRTTASSWPSPGHHHNLHPSTRRVMTL